MVSTNAFTLLKCARMSITENLPSRFTTLSELLAYQANALPAMPAIEAPSRHALTYQGLWEQVSSVATFLKRAGVTPADRISLLLPNGPEMAVAFLAAASAGCAAPLNPAYRTKELEFYLSDLRPSVLLIDSRLDSPARDLAPSIGAIVIDLVSQPDAPAGVFALQGDADNESEIQPRDVHSVDENSVALVLHTSGTTSRPKQVPLTQANVILSAWNIVRTLDLGSSDCGLNIMPLFHIHGLIAGLVAPLAAGGRVVCTDGLDPENFFGWIERYRPTWYSAVPTMHQVILDEAGSQDDKVADARLRFIRSSSAALAPGIMQELETMFNCPVIEAYGMTEATHQMTSNPLPPQERKAGSVGLPAGSEIAIMDEAGSLSEQGATGEIVICGGTVTVGYQNNLEANESSFHNGWFRTGDQGHIDPDGYLFITGRLKEIINRGGENIQPREIDEALMALAGVQHAVAFAVPHLTLGEDLAAAVVISPDSGLTESALRAFAFEQLADYKVPSQVLIVDSIPKGDTGKLQRIGLAELLSEQLDRHYVAPRNDLEQTITDLFSEVLGLDGIGVHDNFFSLGGDSIRGTQLIGRLQAGMHVELPVVLLFQKPTIAELSEHIAASSDYIEADALSDILAELEMLSDEEAAQLLSQELGQETNTTGKG
jgi:acyl-CoA synthetase (AMP-forming)/AMP-acid ligase II/acyl carrier protein